MTMGDSEAIGDVIDDSRGKVIVTDSWRTESIESHFVSRNDVAHGDIQSGMGSKSTTQTVTSEKDFVVTMLVEKVLEVANKIASKVISVFNVEIIGGNSVVDGVERVGSGAGFESFFGELSGSLGSTEGSDDFSGAIIDKERIRYRFRAPESVGILFDETVARKIVTSITTFHVIKVFSFTIRSTGSSQKSTSKTFIISLN